MDTIFDAYSKEKIEKLILEINKLAENGVQKGIILEKFAGIKFIEEIIDVAAARKRFREKQIDKRLYLNMNDLRFSTPKIIADYRAEKLKCNAIADLGCGTGMQSLAFAKKCKKVYAVEIDERKIRYAKENAKILGIKNIEFIRGDVLDGKIINKIKSADAFFCDPSRLPSETERKLETILPDPRILVKKYPKNLAMEFPPQMQKIDFDCEREYLSVNGVLNRLTLYFGGLKKSDYSAVALPSKERLEAEKKEELGFIDKKGLPMEYLYEIDTAVLKAGLAVSLMKKTGAVLYETGLLTSDKMIKSPFFRNSFRVLEACHSDFGTIVKSLQKHDIGNIVLRQRIDPKLYWKTRTDYEKHLKGKKTAHLFIFEKVVIAEKI